MAMTLYRPDWSVVATEWVYNNNGGNGFATLANSQLNEPLPAGDYILIIWNFVEKTSDIVVESFFMDQQGTVTLQE